MQNSTREGHSSTRRNACDSDRELSRQNISNFSISHIIIRLSHADFCQRYSMLLPRNARNDMGSVRDRCRLIYRSLFDNEDKENQSGGSSAQQLGKTKIFLREGQVCQLFQHQFSVKEFEYKILMLTWSQHNSAEKPWFSGPLQSTLVENLYNIYH